jgi:glucosamine kinase
VKKRWLGVDAGGTKTHAVVLDEDGAKEAEFTGGPGNPLAVGDEVALASWRDVVSAVTDEETLAGAHFGVAGAGRPADLRRAGQLATRSGLECPISLSDDARIAFRANADFPGAILVAGTGSIAVAYDASGSDRRAGGHGHLLGDEGSAYWIAVAAVRAALRAADGRGPATALTNLVPALLGVGTLDEIVSGVYSSGFDRTALARFAPEVVALEDEVAGKIKARAVDELVAALEAALGHRTGDETALTVVLAGGLLGEQGCLRGSVEERLRDAMPHVRAIPGSTPPAVGAARLAREGAT